MYLLKQLWSSFLLFKQSADNLLKVLSSLPPPPPTSLHDYLCYFLSVITCWAFEPQLSCEPGCCWSQAFGYLPGDDKDNLSVVHNSFTCGKTNFTVGGGRQASPTAALTVACACLSNLTNTIVYFSEVIFYQSFSVVTDKPCLFKTCDKPH